MKSFVLLSLILSFVRSSLEVNSNRQIEDVEEKQSTILCQLMKNDRDLFSILDLKKDFESVSTRLEKIEEKIDNTLSQMKQQQKCQAGCPAQFVQVGNTCMLIGKETMNYDHAVSFCDAYSAHLASPTTPGKLIVLRTFLTESSADSRLWVAATDRQDEGTWKWFDGTTLDPRDKFYWNHNQPDDWSTGEDCAVVAEPYLWKMDDRSCTYKHFPLCQYDPK